MVHLVMACDASDAGAYFNPPAKEYLIKFIESRLGRKHTNVLNSFKQYANKNLANFVKLKTQDYSIDMNDYESVNDS